MPPTGSKSRKRASWAPTKRSPFRRPGGDGCFTPAPAGYSRSQASGSNTRPIPWCLLLVARFFLWESDMALMRSLLYVPANRPRFIESAARSAADVVVLDLEDSVPPSEKAAARKAAAAALPDLIEGGKTV